MDPLPLHKPSNNIPYGVMPEQFNHQLMKLFLPFVWLVVWRHTWRRGWQIHFWSTCPRAYSSSKFICPTFKSTSPTIKTLHSGQNKKLIYIYQHYICFVFPFNKEWGNLIFKLQVKTVLKSFRWLSLCISNNGFCLEFLFFIEVIT